MGGKYGTRKTEPLLVSLKSSGGGQNRHSTVETPRGLRRGLTHFFSNGGWGQEESLNTRSFLGVMISFALTTCPHHNRASIFNRRFPPCPPTPPHIAPNGALPCFALNTLQRQIDGFRTRFSHFSTYPPISSASFSLSFRRRFALHSSHFNDYYDLWRELRTLWFL